jgi:AcrR family transcriptional regulator
VKPDTQTRILDAALALFLEQGMAATRIEQICKGAGVSNGSLFHFFPNKEAIGVALYVGAIASYQAALLDVLAANRPVAETIRALITEHWRWVVAERERARFLFLQGPPSWHPDAETKIRSHNSAMIRALSAWLAAPPQRSALDQLPANIFAALLLGPSMMATKAWLSGGPPIADTHIDRFADAALRSLLKDDAHDAR